MPPDSRSTESPRRASCRLPPRILNRVAGRSLAHLVPDRLMLLASPSVEVLVYPSDVAISGKEDELARARAAIADRLTHAPAYLTMSEEAEKVEDRLGAVAASDAPLAERLGQLKEINSTLAALTVPFDEWETLYRERLQIERDILASARRHGIRSTRGTGRVRHDPGSRDTGWGRSGADSQGTALPSSQAL